MLRKLLSISLFLGFFHFTLVAQQITVVQRDFHLYQSTPVLTLEQPDMRQITLEDEQNDKMGMFYRIGVHAYTNISTSTHGEWITDYSGNRVWQLQVKFAGAEALSFLFDNFRIYDNTTVDIFNAHGIRLHKTMTSADVLDHFEQNMALCFGDEMTIQVKEPAGSRPSEIHIDRIVYNYRATGNPNVPKINESEDCEVNVNCAPVGNNWQDEKRSVARIYIVDSQGAGWCTGALVNNTALDCKPYFLTSLHCGISTSAQNSNLWRFYFKYESPNCDNPTSAGTLDDHYITGCVRISNSNDNGGETGSDYLLLQLGSLANETTVVNILKSPDFNAYWNGWDVNNTSVSTAVTIHHPLGDIKKISTSGATTSGAWGSSVSNTHWILSWVTNSNGYGVTEGGSSGCPLFNNSGRIIGTLTGGAASCSHQNYPDYYGKMSYHWTSNGTSSSVRLKTYLDPINSGATTLNGSNNPCPEPTIVPVADFVANPTTVSSGGTVQLTDLTLNTPTNWSWTINPATGWSYSGGTNANSQNPQLVFTTTGQYTVSLVASNAAGSDTETKQNYITVTVVTTPCTGSTTYCEEFISNITTGAINNSTACTNYAVYPGTSFTKGQQYYLFFYPQIGANPGYAIEDDEFAAWIDYNGDYDFDDQNEQIAYSLCSNSGFQNTFTFTIPTSATVGNVYMRCRLHYAGSDVGDGPITPCGTYTYGEVEDYIINILPPSSSTLSLTCGDSSTIYASSGISTVPDVTDEATALTTCSSGGLTVSQSPVEGSGLVDGINTITILATDNCGNSQTCTTTINYITDLSVNDSFWSSVKIYPIPTDEIVSVDLTGFEGEELSIEIFDNSGKKVSSIGSVSHGLNNISLEMFEKGSYLLQLNSSTGSRIYRVVKF